MSCQTNHIIKDTEPKFRDGSKQWRENGVLHRVGGPAFISTKGVKKWYFHGKLHRLDGPAIEYKNKGKKWYNHGKLHRLNGPAIEWENGLKEWWVNGTKLDDHQLSKYLIDRKLYNRFKNNKLTFEELIEIKLIFEL